MNFLIKKVRDANDLLRSYLYFYPWWEGENLKTIDLFYVLFLFSAVLFCVFTFFFPLENFLFLLPLCIITPTMTLGFALAIIVCVIIFYKEIFIKKLSSN